MTVKVDGNLKRRARTRAAKRGASISRTSLPKEVSRLVFKFSDRDSRYYSARPRRHYPSTWG